MLVSLVSLYLFLYQDLECLKNSGAVLISLLYLFGVFFIASVVCYLYASLFPCSPITVRGKYIYFQDGFNVCYLYGYTFPFNLILHKEDIIFKIASVFAIFISICFPLVLLLHKASCLISS